MCIFLICSTHQSNNSISRECVWDMLVFFIFCAFFILIFIRHLGGYYVTLISLYLYNDNKDILFYSVTQSFSQVLVKIMSDLQISIKVLFFQTILFLKSFNALESPLMEKRTIRGQTFCRPCFKAVVVFVWGEV